MVTLNSQFKVSSIMQRLHIFLMVLLVSIAFLVSLVAISLYLAATTPSYYQSSWMNQMWESMGISGTTGNNGGMGGMMGGGSTTTTNLWIIPVAIIAAALVGLIGLGFYLVLPEIRNNPPTCTSANNATTSATPTQALETKPSDSTSMVNSCDILLKTMKPEEQKVLKVLIDHKGKYLQKYMGKEAGLNRLKTHRIVARFAERGIVSVKPFGNTNEVSVSDWVTNSNAEKIH
jgi:hypothetical protein